MEAFGIGFQYSGAQGGDDPAWRVVIQPGPSRLLVAHVVLVLAAGIAAAWLAPLAPVARFCLVAALGACALAALRGPARGGWRLAVGLTGRVAFRAPGGQEQAGRLLAGSFVAPFLTVVRWQAQGHWFARSALVLPDAVPADEFRRLRVLLRWGSPEAGRRGAAL